MKMQWSLKTRLNLWIASLTTLFSAAAFAWMHFGLISILNVKNSDFLDRKATELLAAVKDNDSGGPEALAAEIRREVQTYATDGLIIALRKAQGLEVVPNSLNNEQIAETIARNHEMQPPGPIEIQIHGHAYLARRIEVQESENQQYPLDLILSLDETRQIQSQFDRRALMGMCAFLTLAISGGYLLTQKALRPVAESIRTARGLQPDQLTARLPVSGTGDEIDELASTINSMLDRLAAYHAQMRRFTADASHELRSPLGAMRAMIEVALQKPRDSMEYRDVLESLGEQCDRLSHLGESLLLLARADAGQVELRCEPVDFGAMIDEITELFEPLAEEKGVVLQWQRPQATLIHADPMRLRQLVTNLLDNAIKFTNPGGHVAVTLEIYENRINLDVIDDGIGISPEQSLLVFDRFYQTDAARSSRGAGLGPSGTCLSVQLPTGQANGK